MEHTRSLLSLTGFYAGILVAIFACGCATRSAPPSPPSSDAGAIEVAHGDDPNTGDRRQAGPSDRPPLRLATDDQLEPHALRPDELTGRKWFHAGPRPRVGGGVNFELQFLESPSGGGLLLNDVRRHYGRTPSASWTVRSVHLYGAIIVIDDQMTTVTIENGELLFGRLLRIDERTWYGVYGSYVDDAPSDPGVPRSGWHLTEYRYQFIDDPFEIQAGRLIVDVVTPDPHGPISALTRWPASFTSQRFEDRDDLFARIDVRSDLVDGAARNLPNLRLERSRRTGEARQPWLNWLLPLRYGPAELVPK